MPTLLFSSFLAGGRTQDLGSAKSGLPSGYHPSPAQGFTEHILGKRPGCALREASANIQEHTGWQSHEP
ncbi:hypothetical protein I79_022923 [Cricetulus griseus]|uniref:Uncharacterized protein n=1 Tax=Cricetulus griseus TaxID=10029 RepID=G3IGK6_CRIGR|nr:hypothetical protein I79_022923 [Cricetulus griseus]